MGVVIPVGYGQVRVMTGFIGSTKRWQTTWGYHGDVAEVPNTDAAEIAAILTATGRPWKPAEYSLATSIFSVDVTRMTSTGPIMGTAPLGVPGSKSVTAVPINTSFLLQKSTARGGRKGRGRCFLPPIWTAENNVDAQGIITTFDLNAMNALWSSALTALLASDCPPVLLHEDGSTPDPITSWAVTPLCATQRRRMRS